MYDFEEISADFVFERISLPLSGRG